MIDPTLEPISKLILAHDITICGLLRGTPYAMLVGKTAVYCESRLHTNIITCLEKSAMGCDAGIQNMDRLKLAPQSKENSKTHTSAFRRKSSLTSKRYLQVTVKSNKIRYGFPMHPMPETATMSSQVLFISWFHRAHRTLSCKPLCKEGALLLSHILQDNRRYVLVFRLDARNCAAYHVLLQKALICGSANACYPTLKS